MSATTIRLAERIRAARLARGWSINALAARAGIGNCHLTTLERHGVPPRTFEPLRRVCAVLELNEQEIRELWQEARDG